jgi:nitrite reductase/ring-hydroxylating ferredoxin subunit
MPLVSRRNEIGPGEMRAIDLQGTRVGIANVDGRFFAFADTCTYADHPLSQGRLEGLLLTCPTDGSQFDLAGGNAGNVVKGPATRRIRTYRVQLDGDDLHI